jgi:hypothetical protein
VEEQQERDQEQEKKQEQKSNKQRLLPTAKNKGANFASRVNAQYLYYNIFIMIPCHLIPDDFDALMADVKNILTSLSNERMPILTPTDKLNVDVASWDHPSCNVMTSVSSLLLEDNVGKDGLSSQSTYKYYIQDFDASGMVVASFYWNTARQQPQC